MDRILTYRITEDCPPSTIKEFLKRKGFSSRTMIALKKEPGCVLRNGEPVYLTHPVVPGDELVIRFMEEKPSENIKPVLLPLSIVYEDEDLCVVNKPANMPIHPSQNNRDNSLANAMARYYAGEESPFVFRCINRLDRDTSGLTIVAKNAISAGILSDRIARKSGENGIQRRYLAIVKGVVTPEKGIIDAPIARKEGSIVERCINWEHGEHAITHYRLLQVKEGHSLVELELETGRTHQIRVHMKHLGYPLIGDYLYNPDTERMNRQALHAASLSFRHPITGEAMQLTAPLPADMQWMAL